MRSRHIVEAKLVALAVVTFAALALGVHLTPALRWFDLTTVSHAHEVASVLGDGGMLAVADIAASDTVLMVTILCAAVLVASRHWHGALALTVSVAVCQGLVAVLKHVIARDRPPGEDAMIAAAGHSFPSAHSATSVALYGLLALIASHELRDRVSRAWAIAGACALCVAVGASRVYLGAHYPTDVLAGWLVGCVIALGSWRGALALRGRLSPAVA
jgi:membrane-associated phospholipid phosphatase